VQRRSILRGFGFLALAPVLASSTDLDPDRLWREAVEYARWTPSPHNIQPWRLRPLSPTSAELYCDPGSFLPTTDPSSAFTLMGLAMFVEYLAVALRPLGYSLRTEYVQRPLDYAAILPVLVARLDLESGVAGDAGDRQLILDRRTSRLPYDGTAASGTDMSAIAALSAEHGHEFGWSSDEAMVRWVLELNRNAMFADLDSDPARDELRHWIRCTDAEAQQASTGLWSKCLQFPGWLLKDFFDSHDRWGTGWRRRMCGRMLVSSMRGTRTVAWWRGPFAAPEDWLRCGTLFARSWLELTRRGLSLHPFGSVITNPQAHALLRDRLGLAEQPDRLWLLARVGRSNQAPRSFRLAPRDVFIDATAVGVLA
jgi:hypothetical protein